MAKKQFSEVSSRYGAPMGRTDFGTPEHAQCKIRVFRVKLDSWGYDDGGAYWGGGKPLFCATDGADYRQFTRADSRLHAVAELEIEAAQLAMPPRAQFARLRYLESMGRLGASGVVLRQKLETLGFAA